jgi:hypothetical protein
MSEIVYCTADHCWVSYRTGTGIDGAELRVSSRQGSNDQPLHGHGMLFPSIDAARAFAVEHGYVEPYTIVRNAHGRFDHLQRVTEN